MYNSELTFQDDQNDAVEKNATLLRSTSTCQLAISPDSRDLILAVPYARVSIMQTEFNNKACV